MINYNILKIIVDKVTTNQWKNKVKKMNKEYKKIYFYADGLKGHKCICGVYFYRSRNIQVFYRHYISIGYINKCLICGYLGTRNITIKVPERYHYTSGMDHLKGYKKLKK